VEEGLFKHQTPSLYAPPTPHPRNSLKNIFNVKNIFIYSKKNVDAAFKIVICIFISIYTILYKRGCGI
jgi:hypothetical protein